MRTIGTWTRARTFAPVLGIAAVMAVGLLFPFAWGWLSGRTFVYRDCAMLYAPQRWLAGSALRDFRLPLWNPYAGTGIPFFAETVHGVLHPLSIAVAFLFRNDALDPLLGAYVLSAGLGAAVMARCMGASPLASVTAAFAYGLSGYSLSMTGNLVYLAGAGSLPWVTAGLLSAGRVRTPGAFAAGAAGVAACALSGDLQALAVGAALGVCLGFEAGRLRGLAWAMGSMLCGALLAGVQLAPSWRYLEVSDRAPAIAAREAQQWALAGSRMLEVVIPGLFAHPPDQPVSPVYWALGGSTTFRGAPFAMSIFVGAPVLVLVAAGMRSSRSAKLLGAAAIVLTWLALGHQLGAQQVLSSLPIVRGFRYAEKFVGPLTLCLSALAALGVDRVAGDAQLARRMRALAIACGAVASVAWLVLAPEASLSFFVVLGPAAAPELRARLLVGFAYVAWGLGAFAGALVLARRQKTVAVAAIAAIVWLESTLASTYALDPGEPQVRLQIAPPVLDAAHPGARVLTPFEVEEGVSKPGWDFEDQWAFQSAAVLAPSFNVRHRIDSFGMDSGIRPSRYSAALATFEEQWRIAARRYGVTHVLVPSTKPPPADGVLVGTEPLTGAAIWSVPHRAWASFPPAVEVASGIEDARARLRRLHDLRSDGAVVEADTHVSAAPGVVHSVTRGRERVELDAETAEDSVLVVNDAFSPGWRASIDGVAVPVWPADVLVRAVPWPAGRHTLRMEYESPGVSAGAWMSALGALLLAAPFVLRRRSRSRAR